MWSDWFLKWHFAESVDKFNAVFQASSPVSGTLPRGPSLLGRPSLPTALGICLDFYSNLFSGHSVFTWTLSQTSFLLTAARVTVLTHQSDHFSSLHLPPPPCPPAPGLMKIRTLENDT